jgi:hypothetical protein
MSVASVGGVLPQAEFTCAWGRTCEVILLVWHKDLSTSTVSRVRSSTT